MVITDALIERFLQNDCTEAEREAVELYIRQHPEYLPALLSEESWREFTTQRSLPADVSARMLETIRESIKQRTLPADESAGMLENIRVTTKQRSLPSDLSVSMLESDSTGTQQPKKSLLVRHPWISAAAVLILALSIWIISSEINKKGSHAVADVNKQPVEQPEYKRTENVSAEPLSLSLPDGTLIELMPGSEVGYPTPFTNNRRDVYLKGQALFQVAKDANRPFTVYAGRLATTALGTVFRITAFNQETKITSIHLLEGKVVVRPDSLLTRKGVEPVILKPGQELRFDPVKQLAMVRVKDKIIIKPILKSPEKLSETKPDDFISFHDQPLDEVFRMLTEKYQNQITFDKAQLTGMSFTGEYNHNRETVFGFVQTVCLLNGLNVHLVDKVIIIGRP
ncbi:MAG: FecR domain-containing protein [Chitinophagaceae bacterium]